MGDSSRNIDVDKLISYSDDFVKVLRDQVDINSMTQCVEHSTSLSSSCDTDFNEARQLLEDYQKKVGAYKQKIEQARFEVAADAELGFLQAELEEELGKERLLGEELSTAIINEFNDLEQQRILVQERKKTSQKLEQYELRAQVMLALYASVTNIVPNLDDQSKFSGYIVEKDKNVVGKFEYDSSKMASLDACNEIWKTLDS